MINKAILEFKEETKAFISFLKNPRELSPAKQSFDTKAKIFSILLVVQFLWILVVIPIYSFADYILDLKEADLGSFSLLEILLFGCVFAPLWEEFVFRFPLRFKNNYIFRGINKLLGKNKLEYHWRKNYSWYFYGFAICFGLIHAFNFQNEKTLLFFLCAPLITFSQISTGIILGYLRLKIGFWYGVLFHTAFNFLLIFGSYSLYHNSELFHYKTDKVEIIATYLETDEGKSFYTISEKDGFITNIDAQNFRLDHLTETIIKKKYTSEDVRLLNLKITSKKGISRKELLKILKQEIQMDSP
ncbi:CPBP family intramembrane glutamic endopeptidase [Frigoriflavimonas asaccharolytica]|uniref:CAAX prenyl protease 2/Lysostaphin resistance protein A-like domain-containing protein n=1 Tax=Frigoriflavimonas asaccharolytica TaxID=2735899 RepID=A0A8J8G6B1_9FLAO|nr:CPBP family intramembrane glutamic endopeptidase [Frigoriflavimonas asaccharolytica]NRS91520.1 hypothetical protein [Frigoriflavimonas asaccharolytica]